MRIQELAEELVNLSVKEVNELSNVVRFEIRDMPVRYHTEIIDYNLSTPKEYGMKLYEKKHKKRR